MKFGKISSMIKNKKDSKLRSKRNCPICKSKRAKILITFDNFQFYSDSKDESKIFDLKEVICLECQCVYLNPAYSEKGFQVLFKEAGMSYGSAEKRPNEQIAWLNDRNLLEQNSIILDIGCYEGAFLNKLGGNIKAYGVDIDKHAIDRGNLRAGDNVKLFHGRLEDFKCEEIPNTIVMFHVLEHLANPVKLLNNLKENSNEKTNLVVEVPVLEHANSDDIMSFFSVQHMTHFSKKSLKKCLELGGWEISESCQSEDYNGYRILAKPFNGNSKNTPKDSMVFDIDLLYQYLSAWYVKLSEKCSKINQAFLDSENIIVWGAGMHTEMLYNLMLLKNCRNKFALIDSDKDKIGKTWRGLQINSPRSLEKVENWEFNKVLISSYGSQENIYAQCIRLGVPEQKIIRIYDSTRPY